MLILTNPGRTIIKIGKTKTSDVNSATVFVTGYIFI